MLDEIVRQVEREGVTLTDINATMRGNLGLLWNRVMALVQPLESCVLGVIGASGKGLGEGGIPLYSVHCHQAWLGGYASGRSQLETLATTAIIAHLAERHGWETNS